MPSNKQNVSFEKKNTFLFQKSLFQLIMSFTVVDLDNGKLYRAFDYREVSWQELICKMKVCSFE